MSTGLTSRSNGDLYAAAGLPRANFQTKAKSPTAERFVYDAKIGTLVHQVLARVAGACQHLGVNDTAELVDVTVADLSLGRDLGRGDKARLRITGLVAGYLTTWLPPQRVEFVGAEVPITRGRLDLEWAHPKQGHFFDELKTWRHDQKVLDSATMRQVEKYLDAGNEGYGPGFAGVRLLTLGNREAALWFSPDGLIEPLRGGPLDLTTLPATTNAEVAS